MELKDTDKETAIALEHTGFLSYTDVLDCTEIKQCINNVF